MPRVPHKTGHSVPQRVEPPLPARIGALAERQHGVVAIWQVRALGLSGDAARKRAQRGHWQRMHRGVYFIGHGPMTIHTRWMAAVLAYGPEAVLSHRAA